jgi:molecular chaperone GrpE (heat shock protein)
MIENNIIKIHSCFCKDKKGMCSCEDNRTDKEKLEFLKNINKKQSEEIVRLKSELQNLKRMSSYDILKWKRKTKF